MRNALDRRASRRLFLSSEPERASQNTHPPEVLAAVMYVMRQGAQRRFTPPAGASAVDELAQSLSYLEEGDPFLRNVDARPSLGIAALPRIAVTDPEAPEAPKLDLVALRQRVGDVVEDRVDDYFGLFLGQARDLRNLVYQVGFGHRLLPSKFRGDPGSNSKSKLARRRRECLPP